MRLGGAKYSPLTAAAWVRSRPGGAVPKCSDLASLISLLSLSVAFPDVGFRLPTEAQICVKNPKGLPGVLSKA